MATRTFRVTSYELNLGSKLLVSVRGPNGPRPVPAQATIQCFGEGGESFAIFFLNENRAVPHTNSDEWPNTAGVSQQRVWAEMFVPASQFTWYADVLRSEHFVYAHIDESAPTNNRISR